MSILEICLLSVGLAMDCFAVSVAASIAAGRYDWLKMLRMALYFGFFQGLMPLIGWALGVSFEAQIKAIDHWLALAILSYLGGKMIWESFKSEEFDPKKSPFGSMSKLLSFSVATSIDALATGLIFVPLGNQIFSAAAIIALGSFLFAMMGCIIGIEFGRRFKLNVGLLGGLILIGIGVKILIEHLINGC